MVARFLADTEHGWHRCCRFEARIGPCWAFIHDSYGYRAALDCHLPDVHAQLVWKAEEHMEGCHFAVGVDSCVAGVLQCVFTVG